MKINSTENIQDKPGRPIILFAFMALFVGIFFAMFLELLIYLGALLFSLVIKNWWVALLIVLGLFFAKRIFFGKFGGKK